jgi:hypothetical protein
VSGVPAGNGAGSVVAGSAWYVSRSWRAERALGPGGKTGGGPGGPGNRALGGFRVPPVLAPSVSRRHGAVCVYCRARRGALCAFHGYLRWFCLPFPRSFVRRLARAAFACSFLGHWFGGVLLQCGSGLAPPGVCLLAE